MSFGFDLAPQDNRSVLYDALYKTYAPEENEEPGWFEGDILKPAAMGVMRGGAQFVRFAGFAGSFIPRVVDWFNDTNASTDAYFDAVDSMAKNAVDYWTPNAATTSKAGMILGELGTMVLPLMAGGVTGLVGSEATRAGAEVVEAGGSAAAAAGAAITRGAFTAAGFGAPAAVGKNLLSRVASGAGINAVLGFPERAIQSQIAKSQNLPQLQEKWENSWEAFGLDALTGALFGGAVHLGARANQPLFDHLSAEQQDAVLTAQNAKHFQEDSAPGKPADAESSAAHQSAMKTATQQIADGKPVNVANVKGIGEAKFEARNSPDEIAKNKSESEKNFKEASKTASENSPDAFDESNAPDLTEAPKPSAAAKPANKPAGSSGEKTPPTAREITKEVFPRQGKSVKVFTERGDEIPARYVLVEVGDLVTSNRDDLSPNPQYPAELQPRNRNTPDSLRQINKIAKGLTPERLGASAEVSTGAPIVGVDRVVESGNGRTIALRLAYKLGLAGGYRDWLMKNAAEFGLSAHDVTQMKSPALVRVPEVEMNRAEFTKAANESSVATFTASEQANVDAQRMPDLSGLVLKEDGGINETASADFLNKFDRDAVGDASFGFRDKEGNLTIAGRARLRNAIFARAYRDADIVQMMSETADTDIKNVINGMTAAAGEVAKFLDLVDAGARYPTEAFKDLITAARKMAQLKGNGQKVGDYLSQLSMLGEELTPGAREWLTQLNANIRSGKRIGELINRVREGLDAAGDPRNLDIFGGGGTRAPSATEQVVRLAAADIERRRGGLPPDVEAEASETVTPRGGSDVTETKAVTESNKAIETSQIDETQASGETPTDNAPLTVSDNAAVSGNNVVKNGRFDNIDAQRVEALARDEAQFFPDEEIILPDGTGATRNLTVAEAMREADDLVKKAEADSREFEVGVSCFLRHGDGV
jgi:hypothetical protein